MNFGNLEVPKPDSTGAFSFMGTSQGPNCQTKDLLKLKPFIEKSGMLYIPFVGRLVGRLLRHHAGNISDVTLAFEDAQVIPPFSQEDTEDTDDPDIKKKKNYPDDIDYTDDKDNTDDTYDTDDTDSTDDTK